MELVRGKLERIEALNPRLDAFVALTAELASEQAERAKAEIAVGRNAGPLHGIPFGLKDIYNTAGILTTGNPEPSAAISHKTMPPSRPNCIRPGRC